MIIFVFQHLGIPCSSEAVPVRPSTQYTNNNCPIRQNCNIQLDLVPNFDWSFFASGPVFRFPGWATDGLVLALVNSDPARLDGIQPRLESSTASKKALQKIIKLAKNRNRNRSHTTTEHSTQNLTPRSLLTQWVGSLWNRGSVRFTSAQVDLALSISLLRTKRDCPSSTVLRRRPPGSMNHEETRMA